MFPGWLVSGVAAIGLGVAGVGAGRWWALLAVALGIALLVVDARLVLAGSEEPIVSSILCALMAIVVAVVLTESGEPIALAILAALPYCVWRTWRGIRVLNRASET